MTHRKSRLQTTRRKRILTWHVHGNYLYYLTQAHHDFYLPVKPERPEGYGGRAGTLPWGDNIFEVDAGDVRNCDFDVILYQSRKNYLEDRLEILSDEQLKLPQVYLEHDPPLQHPTDTKHLVDDPGAIIVHVTHFNQMMWDSNRTSTMVIEHGVLVPDNVRYDGALEKGISVVNNIARRGRRTGADVFTYARDRVPLDLIGMNAFDVGGLGEIPYHELLAFESRYRFFFNPIRYTSLGLAVCEAMMIGMPILGLATTEMSVAVQNGVNGFVDTNLDSLVECMKDLIQSPEKAQELSQGARQYALEHYHIERFTRDWDRLLAGI